ncbi:ES1 protein homolog mitochondrial [Clonorchis sinensis]|uniref:ES1 protein homolog mitochondrial n=1 Tax=Clonorchis sinensis TaxID=79923 RepID=G7YV21_CLOSI|nr:ES1 protein homolog mitochondrial [Clonorchis sinensis]
MWRCLAIKGVASIMEALYTNSCGRVRLYSEHPHEFTTSNNTLHTCKFRSAATTIGGIMHAIELLDLVDKLVYLDGCISSGGLAIDDISSQIGKARITSANLRHLWCRSDASPSVKSGAYTLVVRFILVHGSDYGLYAQSTYKSCECLTIGVCEALAGSASETARNRHHPWMNFFHFQMAYVRFYSSMPVKRHNVAMHADTLEQIECQSILIRPEYQPNACGQPSGRKCDEGDEVRRFISIPRKPPRNVLVESARIARGKVSPLSELNVKDFDALLIPGGFGVAKNLSDFSEKNAECTVIPDVELCLKGFLREKKPIGAPRQLWPSGERQLVATTIVVGPTVQAFFLDDAAVPTKFGVKLRALLTDSLKVNYMMDWTGRVREISGCYCRFVDVIRVDLHDALVRYRFSDIQVDEEHKIVTGSAYMCGTASVSEVFDGIGRIVDAVVHM